MERATTDPLVYWKRELSVCRWIEAVVGVTLSFHTETALRKDLQDGVLLCRLLNKLRDGSIPGFIQSRSGRPLPLFQKKKNVKMFLTACEHELCIPRALLFQANDLLNLENIVRVVSSLVIVAVAFETMGSGDLPKFERNIPDHVAKEFMGKLSDNILEHSRILLDPEEKRIKEYMKNKKRRKSLSATNSDASVAPSRPTSAEVYQLPPPDQLEIAERGIIRLQAIVRGRLARKQFEELQRQSAYRFKIAMEILTTEQFYNYNLQMLTEMFLDPLLAQGAAKIISPLKPIYSNIQIIRGYSEELLRRIQIRVQQWSEHQELGDVFLDLGDYLKIYTQYVQHYTKCSELLSGAQKHFPDLIRYIKELERDPVIADSKWPFESYLMQPVQRIPRYELLVKELLKNTSPDHVGYATLAKAKEKIAEINALVNERQKELEAVSRVLELNQMFGKQLCEGPEGLSDLVQSHRRFVRESIMKIDGRKCACFLFNDLLIIGTRLPLTRSKQYKLRRIIRLRGCSVKSCPEPTVGLILNDDEDASGIKMICPGEYERARWMEDLKNSIEFCATLKVKEGADQLSTRKGSRISQLHIPSNIDEHLLLKSHRESSMEMMAKKSLEVGEAQWSAAKTIPPEIMNALKEQEMEKIKARNFVAAGSATSAATSDKGDMDMGENEFFDEDEEDGMDEVLLMANLTNEEKPISSALDAASWSNTRKMPTGMIEALKCDEVARKKERNFITVGSGARLTVSGETPVPPSVSAVRSPSTSRKFSFSRLSSSLFDKKDKKARESADHRNRGGLSPRDLSASAPCTHSDCGSPRSATPPPPTSVSAEQIRAHGRSPKKSASAIIGRLSSHSDGGRSLEGDMSQNKSVAEAIAACTSRDGATSAGSEKHASSSRFVSLGQEGMKRRGRSGSLSRFKGLPAAPTHPDDDYMVLKDPRRKSPRKSSPRNKSGPGMQAARARLRGHAVPECPMPSSPIAGQPASSRKRKRSSTIASIPSSGGEASIEKR